MLKLITQNNEIHTKKQKQEQKNTTNENSGAQTDFLFKLKGGNTR